MKQHGERFSALCARARDAIREIDAPTLLGRLDRPGAPVLVDVREDHEWAAGRIPGAVHLGRGILERDVEAAWPDLGTELVLYCGGGFRSALAARSLEEMGYTNVASLAGGQRGWRADGLPWDDSPVPVP